MSFAACVHWAELFMIDDGFRGISQARHAPGPWSCYFVRGERLLEVWCVNHALFGKFIDVK